MIGKRETSPASYWAQSPALYVSMRAVLPAKCLVHDVKMFVWVIAWFVVIFSINTTSDISKLLYVISRAVRRVKFETILKYHEWYLCQILRTNHAIICLYYYPQRFVILICRYFKLRWNTNALSQSNCRNFSCSSINGVIYAWRFFFKKANHLPWDRREPFSPSKIKRVLFEDADRKGKFKRILSFLFVEKEKLLARKLDFSDFDQVFFTACPVLKCNQDIKVCKEFSGTFFT